MLLAFVLASAIGGVAGFLVLATDQQVTPMFGMWATHQGPDRHDDRRARLGPGRDRSAACVLGIVEAHSQWYFGPQVRDLVAYVLLFAVSGAAAGRAARRGAGARSRGARRRA